MWLTKKDSQILLFFIEKFLRLKNIMKKDTDNILSNIENNKVFDKDEVVTWKCGNCGYIFEGKSGSKIMSSLCTSTRIF